MTNVMNYHRHAAVRERMAREKYERTYPDGPAWDDLCPKYRAVWVDGQRARTFK